MKTGNAFFLLTPVLLSCFYGCVTAAASVEYRNVVLSAETQERINEACFEVVIHVPEENLEITYEKEIPQRLLQHFYRYDKYMVIGTAFAISETELCTAFHVLRFERQSRVFTKFYLRDKKGEVFEFDRITRADNRRDVVFFTVKNRRFNRYFHMQKSYTLNDPVFTVGSALGDGIVIRNGLLIGETLERLEGKFYLLKASAGVNPGNSGGPLLDARGNVIGIIQLKNDNIVYSLPISGIDDTEKNKLVFSAPFTKFRFVNLNRESSATLSFELPLPLSYQDVIQKASSEYDSACRKYMDRLLAEKGEALFPDGEKSEMLVYSVQSPECPELIYENKEDGMWNITRTVASEFFLPGSGRMEIGELKDGIKTFNLIKPDNISLRELYDSPKLTMDLYLKGANVSRRLGNESLRISSLGSPIISQKHADRYDRKWSLNVWLINHDDKVIIVMTLPSPTGLSGVSLITDSYRCNPVLEDFRAMADFMHLSLEASVGEWMEYLACREEVPAIFRDVIVGFDGASGFMLKTPGFFVRLDDSVMHVSRDSRLKIDMGFSSTGGKTAWNFRRILVKKGPDSLDYFMIGKELKPPAGLPREVQEGWDRIMTRKHPFTGKPFSSEGLVILGDLHKRYQNTGTDTRLIDHLYTVTIGTESEVTEEDFRKRFDVLMNSISITE